MVRAKKMENQIYIKIGFWFVKYNNKRGTVNNTLKPSGLHLMIKGGKNITSVQMKQN